MILAAEDATTKGASMEWIFAFATVWLFYTYLGYGLLLAGLNAVMSKRPGRNRARKTPRNEDWPSVTVVVAAYNEVGCIDKKLSNSMGLDYPEERLQIVIGSDGSTDGTDLRVLAMHSHRVVLSSAQRAGKASVLNRCIPWASGEVIVLTDANTELAKDAVKQLVSHFDDPQVGAVCGRLQMYPPGQQYNAESSYWQFESWLKENEGKIGRVLGANGGIYAIRKKLFEPLPAETIIDDFVIPMRILAAGHRVEYVANALAFEATSTSLAHEFRRHVRIAAGNFQCLKFLPTLRWPWSSRTAFAFFSHKLLRWYSPIAWALLGVSTAALAWDSTRFFRLIFLGQMALLAMALWGAVFPSSGRVGRLAQKAAYFVGMHVALFLGWVRHFRNKQGATWEKAPRSAAKGPAGPIAPEVATLSQTRRITER